MRVKQLASSGRVQPESPHLPRPRSAYGVHRADMSVSMVQIFINTIRLISESIWAISRRISSSLKERWHRIFRDLTKIRKMKRSSKQRGFPAPTNSYSVFLMVTAPRSELEEWHFPEGRNRGLDWQGHSTETQKW